MRLLVLGLISACSSGPRLEPAEVTALTRALEWPGLPSGQAPAFTEGEPLRIAGGSMAPLRFDLGVPTQTGAPFELAAALLRPDLPTGAGVVVAHGHFEGGKSTPEGQAIARRLMARGATVLVVDTPGVEEWDLPSRRIHFAAGAHNRAWLAAGGESAIGLQVAGLQRGLDILDSLGLKRLGATGASGGAAQAFYLALVDPRVSALVLASVPPMPRELRASGCACDQVPGWPGPDPRVLATLTTPTLWMTETPSPKPEGLRRRVRFEVVEGDHGYPDPMQQRALDFFADRLKLRTLPWEGEVEIVDLRSPVDPTIGPPITELFLTPDRLWIPLPEDMAPYELDCKGPGPVVIVAGGEATDRDALQAAGLQPCSLVVPLDEADLSEAIGSGGASADHLAGAIARAGRARNAVAAYGVRAWGLPAGGSGLPFVVRDPLLTASAVDPTRDPSWVHVPGAWWGAADRVLAQALLTGEDPTLLASRVALLAGLPGDAE